MRLMTARCLVFASSFSSSGAVWVADLLNLKAAQKKHQRFVPFLQNTPVMSSQASRVRLTLVRNTAERRCFGEMRSCERAALLSCSINELKTSLVTVGKVVLF